MRAVSVYRVCAALERECVAAKSFGTLMVHCPATARILSIQEMRCISGFAPEYIGKEGLAGSSSFGSSRAAPLVTYGVSPRAKNTAQSQSTESSRNLAKNIAGFVTPAAALSLGVLAFVTISDQAEQAAGEQKHGNPGPVQPPGDALVRTKVPTAGLSSSTEIAPKVETEAGKPDSPPTYSGNIAREDITTVGGELTSVRLGALNDIVETELGAERYAELAGSPNAQAFIDRTTLQASGINAAFHPGSGTISLWSNG